MPGLSLAEFLDHFVVPVDDLGAAEEFYVRVFGATKSWCSSRRCWVDAPKRTHFVQKSE